MGIILFLFIPVVVSCDDIPIVFSTYGDIKIILKTVDQILGDDRDYTYDEVEPLVDHMDSDTFTNACVFPIKRELGELRHSMYCDAVMELEDIFSRWKVHSVKRFNIILLTHMLIMVSTRGICDPIMLETIGLGFNLLVSLSGMADGNPVKGVSFDEAMDSTKGMIQLVLDKGGD
jgi:hypothetical protein